MNKSDALLRIRSVANEKCNVKNCSKPGTPYFVYRESTVDVYCICEVCKRYLVKRQDTVVWLSAAKPVDLDTVYEDAVCALVGTSHHVADSFRHTFDSLLSGESLRLVEVAGYLNTQQRRNSEGDVKIFEKIRDWINSYSDLEYLRERVHTYEVLSA